MSILEIENVQLSFKEKRILTDVYLKCETGTVTGLLGRNGTGKSCLMKIIFGSLSGQNQHLRIDGNYTKSVYAQKGLLSYLSQFNFIPKDLKLKSIFKDYTSDYTVFAAYFPEFLHLENEKIRNLSAGQVRLVEVYIILNIETGFVMLDEPFSHIMPLHIETLKQVILRQKQHKGILISDHLYEPILEISDNLYILKNARIQEIHSADELVKHGYISRL
jgi:ABC-type multidrug transport system ATPase subunit